MLASLVSPATAIVILVLSIHNRGDLRRSARSATRLGNPNSRGRGRARLATSAVLLVHRAPGTRHQAEKPLFTVR